MLHVLMHAPMLHVGEVLTLLIDELDELEQLFEEHTLCQQDHLPKTFSHLPVQGVFFHLWPRPRCQATHQDVVQEIDSTDRAQLLFVVEVGPVQRRLQQVVGAVPDSQDLHHRQKWALQDNTAHTSMGVEMIEDQNPGVPPSFEDRDNIRRLRDWGDTWASGLAKRPAVGVVEEMAVHRLPARASEGKVQLGNMLHMDTQQPLGRPEKQICWVGQVLGGVVTWQQQQHLLGMCLLGLQEEDISG